MNTRKKTQFMTMTALLTAIAILIPIVMPFKIVIPPASYTLGSHIAIFIAMFLSPLMAVFVILASSFGFLMGLLSLTVNTITILPTSYLFSPFVPNGNIYSAIIAIVPRILIGLTPYLVYKLMKNKTGLILAGALGSLTNTVFVLGGIFYLFGNVFDGNIQKLLATVISTNSIAELVISAVLTLAIVPRLQTLKK